MLSKYHQRYSEKSDEELDKRIAEKEKELVVIKFAVNPVFNSNVIDVAIIGCGDKRFIKGHRKIFLDVFGQQVNITTFDITVDHLTGENNVYQHDCTLPLPNGPYDITFAHVLLRFIEKEKQWQVVANSFDVLKTNGIAIHVLDPEDYENIELVDLPAIEEKLLQNNIKFKKIKLSIGIALVLIK